MKSTCSLNDIHPFVYPSIHPSSHSSNHPSIHLSSVVCDECFFLLRNIWQFQRRIHFSTYFRSVNMKQSVLHLKKSWILWLNFISSPSIHGICRKCSAELNVDSERKIAYACGLTSATVRFMFALGPLLLCILVRFCYLIISPAHIGSFQSDVCIHFTVQANSYTKRQQCEHANVCLLFFVSVNFIPRIRIQHNTNSNEHPQAHGTSLTSTHPCGYDYTKSV